jgi:hypothetical protein
MSKTLLDFANDIVLSQYPSEEAAGSEVTVAVPEGSLRVIGQFITRLTESDILQFLAIMEPSLSRWIADEQGILNEEQHKEIVSGNTYALRTLPSNKHLPGGHVIQTPARLAISSPTDAFSAQPDRQLPDLCICHRPRRWAVCLPLLLALNVPYM